jgi:hypothetical protein
MAFAVTALLLLYPMPARSSSKHDAARRGDIVTLIAGGWQGTPTAVPTSASADPDFTGLVLTDVAAVTLNGSWTGLLTEDQRTTFDRTSGDVRAVGTGSFSGMYLGDHSTGTVAWTETWTGNVFTGAFWGVFNITGGGGDATFRCSSGRITLDGYVAGPLTSYGGYHGTWIHGC